jgi:hypothetical protein
VRVAVVRHRVDPLDPGVDPALVRADEIDPVRGGAWQWRWCMDMPEIK